MTIMKDSGIEWIGQIPKNWIEVPFKAYFTTGKGLSFTKADLTPQGHAVVSYGQVHSKANTGTRLDDSLLRYVPDSITENGESSRMNKGDFIFADTSEDLEGCGNCVYVDRDIELYAGYHSVTAKPKAQYNNKFFAYYFQTPCWRNQIRSRVTGIKVFSISQSIINKTWLFVPPLLTQQKIANYLDKVCSDIDDMIALQEQMIEELKAYKQSVITEAVTKGLNPDVPLKDSGIDWIGEIPKHWKVCRIKNVAELFGRIGFRGYTSDDLNKDGIGAITLSPSNMKPMGMDYTNVTYLSWRKYEESPEIKISNKDLLMVKTGSSYGKVSYVENLPQEATINPQILRIVPHISSKYLGYYMQTSLFIYQVEGGIVGGTIPTISQEKINNFYVILPFDAEQQQIASHLDTKCAEIDALIEIKQAKIEELKEYKKSIIYEYVTGKKEVV